MKTYFGFAISDTMFIGDCTIIRQELSIEEVKEMFEERKIHSCLNKHHAATVNAMQQKFGLFPDIPDVPPKVELQDGDQLIVMAVDGLPRLTDKREYTQEEINNAEFTFALYQVCYQ